MTFRLYQLSGGSCANPKVCCGSGKVFISSSAQPKTTKHQAQQPSNMTSSIQGSGITPSTSSISKPVQNKVNPNIEDLQMKLSALSSTKTKRNGKTVKRFVAL